LFISTPVTLGQQLGALGNLGSLLNSFSSRIVFCRH
jgi:hypothetical protein